MKIDKLKYNQRKLYINAHALGLHLDLSSAAIELVFPLIYSRYDADKVF
jgi:hypothetical protein